MPDCEALVKVQYRLEAAGIATRREENVSCCYSRQTKFWVIDPDRTLWEIYTLEPQDATGNCNAPAAIEVKSDTVQGRIVSRERVLGVVATDITAAAGGIAIWHHWLGEPVPEAIPHFDDSLDEVQLEGTFNQELPPGCIGQLSWRFTVR